MDELIQKWQNEKSPVYNFIADDGISHTIWVISDDQAISNIANIFSQKVTCTYIADGHHRAASAAKVRQSLDRGSNPGMDYFLTTLFPANQLHIMDYNRLVGDLNGLNLDDFFSRLSENFEISQEGKASFSPKALHEFGMYMDGKWYKLIAKPGTYSEDPVSILDVSILQNNVLDKILGIHDPRTDKRIDFVGGIRGLGELEKRVESGEMKLGFSLYPVSIQQLFEIADTGNVMPPKSTWFEPKLRDGLLTNLIR